MFPDTTGRPGECQRVTQRHMTREDPHLFKPGASWKVQSLAPCAGNENEEAESKEVKGIGTLQIASGRYIL